MAKKVRDLMTPAPVCMETADSVLAAAKAMKEHGIGTVLVLADGQLRGILTDRDITIRVLAEGRDPGRTQIGEICSTDLVWLDPDDDVSEAVRLVRDRAIRRIPVVAAGQPVGVLSIGDLALAQDERSALADVSAAPPNT